MKKGFFKSKKSKVLLIVLIVLIVLVALIARACGNMVSTAESRGQGFITVHFSNRKRRGSKQDKRDIKGSSRGDSRQCVCWR